MTRRRQTIATRLVEAQHTAAMLTTFNEIDMSAVMAIRAKRKDSFKEKNGIGLGFMSFFTKATIGALKAFPLLNAEIQGQEIVKKGYYDIGIAVGAEEGLVVPVVRDADKKTFAEIEKSIADLAKRARENTLTLPELAGRHVHHHQRRRLRLAAVHADPERPPGRHSGPAQDRAAPHRASTAKSSSAR